MSDFDPQAYGRVLAPLLDIDRRRPLDRGAPDAAVRPALEQLDLKATFADATPAVADPQMGACCLSGAWLLHDCLDESHTISQNIETPSGSFWHAMMHRREGDFSNAKYWFRQVGSHAVFERLGQRAVEVAASRDAHDAADRLAPGAAWDPFAFVDFCEAALRGGDAEQGLCLDLQQTEWELLFDHCYRAAVGRASG